MSREQKLSKKIAHTLLAMSIVYSGGMNVLCNTAFAAGKGADGADKKENGYFIGNGNIVTLVTEQSLRLWENREPK